MLGVVLLLLCVFLGCKGLGFRVEEAVGDLLFWGFKVWGLCV